MSVLDVERRDLRSKLDQSVVCQMRYAPFYGLICFLTQLANLSTTLINGGLLAGLFFRLFLTEEKQHQKELKHCYYRIFLHLLFNVNLKV